ncbi:MULTISPECIES: hypothetical protein [Exiguobacterium]|uniref:Uncharacterized protein n=1 Tax=Exiguobacterium antarcticum TaxID=132920 RepID=A0ABT6QZY5_9BACL|nr:MULTISPECIES: hypothetical protein [Exiguobacterium]MCT4779949.1 hypothetical protein [Exiguobacterium soli]MDI3234260.1 hypothetical protein [Exiguobacterium antarcticum]
MKQEFDQSIQSLDQTKRTDHAADAVQQANWNPDRYRTNLNPFYLSPCSVERREDRQQEVDRIVEVEPTSSPLQQLFEQKQEEHITKTGSGAAKHSHSGGKFTTGIVVGAIIGGSVSIFTSVKRFRKKRQTH